jgi:hypothetical protein
MYRVKILSALIPASLLLAWGGSAALATTIPITDYDFNTQNIGGYSYAQPAPGWDQGPNDGLIRNAAYQVDNPPDGDTQGGYFNDYFAQSIGTLDTNAVYTVDFYLSANTNNTVAMNVELVGGNETSGTVLASEPFTVTTGNPAVYTYEPATLIPVGGTPGEALYLEFVRTSGQNFIDTITASYTDVPEPSACLYGLVLIGGLLTKRHRISA